MSAEKGTTAGWYAAPDGEPTAEGEVVESWEPDGQRRPMPTPRLVRTARDAAEAAAEWMRWMGFADAAGLPVDGEGGIDVISAAVAPSRREDAPVPNSAVVPVYPTLVSDGRALSIIRKQKQGHLHNKEDLAWVRQTWLYLYRIRNDFTSKAGLGKQLRFASSQQLFDSISGRPFGLRAPDDLELLEIAGPTVLPVGTRVAPTQIINETVETWNDYCGLAQQTAAQKRYAAALEARGVPAPICHTISVDLDTQLLVPVFVGLLTHSTGHRLVVLDGVGGKLQAAVTAGMTSNYRFVMDGLERNRLVGLEEG